ncbi:hypothetical protein BDW74DRAFT_71352 [Aspergillus multicolor]|uniref:uncharacterized protein n=1 Tax=Aspergillus multicolor TaxID=41759 RepID=UPI003CCDD4A9
MSTFDFSTTGPEVIERWGISLAGKTAIITGASTGTLGGTTAKALAAGNPSHIILLARSEAKVHDVKVTITKSYPSTKCSFVPIELDNFDSVRDAADTIEHLLQSDDNGGSIDLLINNAGVMAIPWAKSKAGIEKTLAINHLGHFLLTGLLMPLLLKGESGSGGRVVNLSSAGYMMGPFRRDDWNFSDGETYHHLTAYAQSKTANILFTRGLAKRFGGKGLTAFAAHPGYIPDTSLVSHTTLNPAELDRVSRENTGQPFAPDPPKSLEQGIATTLIAALSPETKRQNGAYLVDCQVSDVRDYAKDPDLVDFLWELSEELVGGGFDCLEV